MKRIDLPTVFANLDEEQKFHLYRRLWQQAARYEVLTSFPLHLDIELSGLCNLRCAFCFQNGLIQQKLGLMKVSLFKQIIDQAVPLGLCAVKLQVRGESFLHPRLFDCIAYAKQKGVLDVQITTNGTMLDRHISRNILESGLDGLIVSVDAHHGDSFTQKHHLKTYDTVEQAVQEFLQLRSAHHKSKPWVRLQASVPQNDPGVFETTRAYLAEKFPQADYIAVNRMHNFRNDTDAYPDLQTNYEPVACSYLMQRLVVFWDGQVTTCCLDYNNQFDLGSVQEHGIQRIWLSPKLMQMRRDHLRLRQRSMPICRHCPVCYRPKPQAVTAAAEGSVGESIEHE